MRKIFIIGATSAIAQSTARLFAAKGDALFLAGRNGDKLKSMAADLKVRGASKVDTAVWDALDYRRHRQTIDHAFETMGGIDASLIAHGILPDQETCQESFEKTKLSFEINALSVISMLTCLTPCFLKQKRGTIAVITTVAGDRGRKSNYIYGSAKKAVSTYLDGLRHRLFESGITVLDIRPGFVDTPMTENFKKGPLWVGPEKVANEIEKAISKGGDVVYVPRFWWAVMLVIRNIPKFVFHKTNL